MVALGRGARGGCGVVVGADRVATLRHPLRAERVEVIGADQHGREGRVLGVARATGVAVLEVETGDAPAVRWAAAVPAIGTRVFAFGNPGSGLRVTEGRISAAPLTIRAGAGRSVAVIEHTAPLPSGAGGGPLVDSEGSVLGLNALRADAGFLLALPAAAVLEAVERISAGREPPRIGVELASPQAGRRMRSAVGLPERDGLLVRRVEPGSAAERAGIEAGDLIVALGDVELATVDDLFAALERTAETRSARVRVVRATEEHELAIELGGGAA